MSVMRRVIPPRPSADPRGGGPILARSDRPAMRVLVLSSLFPSATRPTFGVFVRERVRHLRTHCELVVVAPIPWFPFNRWVRGPEQALAPFVEVSDGMTLYHPRFLCLPGLGKCLDGILYFLCLLPFLGWLRRRFPFDLIDAHFTYPDGLAGVLLAKWFRCPGIVTLRGAHDLRHSRYRLRRPQIRFALTAATRVIAVSASLRAAVFHLGVTRDVRVIPNGVDNSRFRPSDRWAARAALDLPQDRAILISVGHIVEGKGHHRVVEVMADLVSRRPDVLYIIIGASIRGDVSRETIDHLVERYGLAAHVRIVPPRPHGEIPTWLAAADLFCLATRYEGWSNAVMEALACGVPTVTTLVGGNAEIVRDGSDGLLVPFWDRRAFGDAVLRALSIPWDRAAIAARMRAHGWERTSEEVVEEFRLSLKNGRRRRGKMSLGDMSP